MISRRQRNVALLVASCFFMQNLDGTIVTTAAPRIAASLHVSSLQISLVITAYLVTFAVLIPVGGWLVARVGTRRVFLSAIVIFTVASMLCALSTNLETLVAMRVLQGVGGALMTPTGRVVALSNVDKGDVLRIMSFIVWPSLIAPVIAPLVGGVITTYASWRWIFLINVPLGAAALLLGFRLMPDAARSEGQRLDLVGVALTTTGLGGLTYTAHLFSVSTPGAVLVVGTVLSLVCIGAAVAHLRSTPAPLLPLRAFEIRTFRAANAGITLFTMVVGSVPFLLPLLFEIGFGWSAIRAGSVVIFVFIGNIGIKPATTYLLNTFGFRRVLATSNAVVAASMVVMGLFSARTPLAVIAVVTLVSGAARSMGFTAYMSLTISDVAEVEMRSANVLAATVQQLAGGLAIAVGAIALHVGGIISSAVSVHPSVLNAYTAAFMLLSLLALAACAMALALPIDAGDSVRRVVSSPQSIDPETATAS